MCVCACACCACACVRASVRVCVCVRAAKGQPVRLSRNRSQQRLCPAAGVDVYDVVVPTLSSLRRCLTAVTHLPAGEYN